MKTMGKLLKTGVEGQNGLIQAFPPNTGVGWSHAGHGHVAGRAWLDEQHLPPSW